MTMMALVMMRTERTLCRSSNSTAMHDVCEDADPYANEFKAEGLFSKLFPEGLPAPTHHALNMCVQHHTTTNAWCGMLLPGMSCSFISLPRCDSFAASGGRHHLHWQSTRHHSHLGAWTAGNVLSR